MERGAKIVLILISAMVVGAIGATAWLFLVKEDYNFVIEESCDPTSETCFHRDCTTSECPPNGLEDYEIYSIKAIDFKTCAEGICGPLCDSGVLTCEKKICSSEQGDTCSVFPDASMTEPASE